MTRDSGSQVYTSEQPTRERVGLVMDGSNAEVAIKTIVAAEDAGVRQIWMTQPPWWPDVLTTFAAAATKTSTVRFGTSIVPTYPRHPLVVAQQALALYDIASSRMRLGIGPSHRFIIEDMYGLQHRTPLAHLREYVEILHAALWEGKVDYHGDFYNVAATLPRKPQIPVLISTLGEKAFQLAGQIADGAISWVCPIQYLCRTGIPALRTSAAAVGRSVPPMVAHVLVALSEDRNSILSAGHQLLDFYAKVPFYANMFSNAGFQPTSDQTVPDSLVDNLVIFGNEDIVAARFTELLATGLDELMVSLVPIKDAVNEMRQLMHLIGQL
ncbi:MAG TPA: LLM class flavin-dependent oxidoreductase [Nitrososphaeraceae archaeon]|nr:LLM class flavin-dependent oxidoreductase [Nitrososphaeraceae archaeon]